MYCQTSSVSSAHATHCATYCTPCRPLIRALSGWIGTLPSINMYAEPSGFRMNMFAESSGRRRCGSSRSTKMWGSSASNDATASFPRSVFSLSSFLLSSLELSDTNVYEPSIRALLGTATHFCAVVVFESRRVLNTQPEAVNPQPADPTPFVHVGK